MTGFLEPIWGSSCLWPHPAISAPGQSPSDLELPQPQSWRVPIAPTMAQSEKLLYQETPLQRGAEPGSGPHCGLGTTGWGLRFTVGSAPTVLESGQLRQDTELLAEPEKDRVSAAAPPPRKLWGPETLALQR